MFHPDVINYKPTEAELREVFSDKPEDQIFHRSDSYVIRFNGEIITGYGRDTFISIAGAKRSLCNFLRYWVDFKKKFLDILNRSRPAHQQIARFTTDNAYIIEELARLQILTFEKLK